MTDAPKKLYVRFSSAEDFDRIMEFYDLNAHQNVRRRQADLLRKVTEDGSVLIVEDADGKIVGTSITYAHVTKDADGIDHAKWQEIGSTRIVLNGYPGLLDAMVAMQTLRTFLVEPPEDRFVARMHTTPVQNMAHKLGFRPFDPPDALVGVQKKSVDPNDQSTADPKVNWFHLGLEALPVLAAHMVTVLDHPVIENRKTGDKIELDFSRSEFFRLMSPEIRHLAERRLGDVENPDMQRSMAEGRRKWMHKYFR